MKRTLTTLALVAMVVVGTGGALAATAANDGPATQHSDEQQLPDDYTVEVTDRTDALSDEDIETAIATAWTNEAVQERVGDYQQPHFDVVVTGEDTVQVSVATGPGAEDDIVAKLDLRTDVVTDVFEPTHTASSVKTIDLNESDVIVHSAAETDDDQEYDEKLTADESMTMQINPENVTLVEDGETVSWVDADESAQDTIEDENVLTPDDNRITAMSTAGAALEFAL